MKERPCSLRHLSTTERTRDYKCWPSPAAPHCLLHDELAADGKQAALMPLGSRGPAGYKLYKALPWNRRQGRRGRACAAAAAANVIVASQPPASPMHPSMVTRSLSWLLCDSGCLPGRDGGTEVGEIMLTATVIWAGIYEIQVHRLKSIATEGGGNRSAETCLTASSCQMVKDKILDLISKWAPSISVFNIYPYPIRTFKTMERANPRKPTVCMSAQVAETVTQHRVGNRVLSIVLGEGSLERRHLPVPTGAQLVLCNRILESGVASPRRNRTEDGA